MAVTALASYGAYRVYKANPEAGKKIVEAIFSKSSGVIATTSDGTKVRKVVETVQDSLKNSNPTGNRQNCPIASMVGTLRQMGIDCTAKACDGQFQTPDALTMARECFHDVKTIPRTKDGAATAVKFGRSVKDAQEMLVKNFGDNAKGIVGFQWDGALDGAGHVISFEVKNGAARFFDFQTGKERGAETWQFIKQSGMLQMARLDDATPDWDALKKYVDF